MTDDAVLGQGGAGGIRSRDAGWGAPGGRSDSGVIGQTLAGAARLYPAPRDTVAALLATGVVLGAAGDALLRAAGPPGLNMSLWIALVAVAALALHRRAALTLDAGRVAWLAIGVVCAAGLAWRDAPPLKLLALGSATLMFAIAAHRTEASWVRGAGVVRYAVVLALGALHAWTAAVLALVDATITVRRGKRGRAAGWQKAGAVARGLVMATPLVVVFGILFVSADAVFEQLVADAFRFDVEWVASHILLFAILAWLSTGYLRGFMTGTEPAPLCVLWREGALNGLTPRRPALGLIEVATVLTALDLLFLAFVVVQFRYLFGGDALVQVTPDLTYAEYARRGFFELVFAAAFVVPVLLAADWLVQPRNRRDALVFRSLAGAQIALVLAVTASAFHRLGLYHASYGLTESRFYAMVLLIWIGAIVVWLAATVLRGRRDLFAAGALVSGLATIAVLFLVSPDAIVARTNVARLSSADASVRFDVAYATSLSADAVPLLIDALLALPPDVQCLLARHVLRGWPPDRDRPIRSWNWSAARAHAAVRAHQTRLRSMVGPDQQCAPPSTADAPRMP